MYSPIKEENDSLTACNVNYDQNCPNGKYCSICKVSDRCCEIDYLRPLIFTKVTPTYSLVIINDYKDEGKDTSISDSFSGIKDTGEAGSHFIRIGVEMKVEAALINGSKYEKRDIDWANNVISEKLFSSMFFETNNDSYKFILRDEYSLIYNYVNILDIGIYDERYITKILGSSELFKLNDNFYGAYSKTNSKNSITITLGERILLASFYIKIVNSEYGNRYFKENDVGPYADVDNVGWITDIRNISLKYDPKNYTANQIEIKMHGDTTSGVPGYEYFTQNVGLVFNRFDNYVCDKANYSGKINKQSQCENFSVYAYLTSPSDTLGSLELSNVSAFKETNPNVSVQKVDDNNLISLKFLIKSHFQDEISCSDNFKENSDEYILSGNYSGCGSGYLSKNTNNDVDYNSNFCNNDSFDCDLDGIPKIKDKCPDIYSVHYAMDVEKSFSPTHYGDDRCLDLRSYARNLVEQLKWFFSQDCIDIRYEQLDGASPREALKNAICGSLDLAETCYNISQVCENLNSDFDHRHNWICNPFIVSNMDHQKCIPFNCDLYNNYANDCINEILDDWNSQQPGFCQEDCYYTDENICSYYSCDMNVLYQTYRFNCSYAEIDINKDSPTIVSPLKNIASFQTNVYCPSTALWKQYDKDNDGVGDECDNCVRDPNKDQANSAAHLGVKQGDACNQDINHDGLPNNLDKDNGFCTFTTSCSERLNNGKYMYPDAVKKCWPFSVGDGKPFVEYVSFEGEDANCKSSREKDVQKGCAGYDQQGNCLLPIDFFICGGGCYCDYDNDCIPDVYDTCPTVPNAPLPGQLIQDPGIKCDNCGSKDSDEDGFNADCDIFQSNPTDYYSQHPYCDNCPCVSNVRQKNIGGQKTVTYNDAGAEVVLGPTGDACESFVELQPYSRYWDDVNAATKLEFTPFELATPFWTYSGGGIEAPAYANDIVVQYCLCDGTDAVNPRCGNCQEDKDSLGSWKYLKLDDNRSFVEQGIPRIQNVEFVQTDPISLREHLQLAYNATWDWKKPRTGSFENGDLISFIRNHQMAWVKTRFMFSSTPDENSLLESLKSSVNWNGSHLFYLKHLPVFTIGTDKNGSMFGSPFKNKDLWYVYLWRDQDPPRHDEGWFKAVYDPFTKSFFNGSVEMKNNGLTGLNNFSYAWGIKDGVVHEAIWGGQIGTGPTSTISSNLFVVSTLKPLWTQQTVNI